VVHHGWFDIAKIYTKISSKKKNSKIIQTMMEYRHCVCVPPGT